MKNAFLRSSAICVSALMGALLTVTSAPAEIHDLARVTFNQPVEVGSVMLPAGNYTIAEDNANAFIVQSQDGRENAVVLGQRMSEVAPNPKTEVILKNSGEALRLNKLHIGGEDTTYEFDN